MKYRLVLQPEAEADLVEAYLWHEKQRVGLGTELIACVEAVLTVSVKTPNCTQRSIGTFGRLSSNASPTWCAM